MHKPPRAKARGTQRAAGVAGGPFCFLTKGEATVALAVPYRKDSLEVAKEILAAVGALAVSLVTALGLGKVWLAMIGRGQSKDDTAFRVLQDELGAVRQRVTVLEEQAARREQEHASEVAGLRTELAEANGERQRLTLLTVQLSARNAELEAKVAERSLTTDPDVLAAARSVAQGRLGDGDG